MCKQKDWTGFKNGNLTVIGKDIERYNKDKERVKNGEIKRFNTLWICKCKCGNTISLSCNKLTKVTCCNKCKDKTFAKDLSGKKFGKWTVINRNYERTEQDKRDKKYPRVYWNCICKCGNKATISTSHLKSGKSTQCLNCYYKEMPKIKYKNFINMKFSNCRIIGMDLDKMKSSKKQITYWKCQCKCGNIFTKRIDKIYSDKNLMCNKCKKKYFPRKNCNTQRIKNNIKKNGSFLDVLLRRYTKEEIDSFWSNKNKMNPNDLTKKSHKNIYIICPICGNTYKISPLELYYRVSDIKCVECGQKDYLSSLELLVKEYINNKLNLKTLHEFKCNLKPINPYTNRILPYDNEIVDKHIIIEVNGRQHYNLLCKDSKWLNGVTPEEFLKQLKWRDNYKKQYAIEHGYKYIVLSYLEILDDSYKEKIKKVIYNDSKY